MRQPPDGSRDPRKISRKTGSGRHTEAQPDASQYAGLGIAMGLSIALFALAGDWVDGRLGTEPLFVIVGVFLGFGGGFYSMYSRLVLKKKAESDTDRHGE